MMKWDGNLLRNCLIVALIAAIVVLRFVFEGPVVGWIILAVPFGMSLLMVLLASAKKTKLLAIISAAIALGGIFFILATATGLLSGAHSGFRGKVYILEGVVAVGLLNGPLFVLFGIVELTSRRRTRKRA
jgi:hypothetical protein